MKGIVVHYQGRFRRALMGRTNEGQLEVRVANPVDPVSRQVEVDGLVLAIRRPNYFVFNSDGQSFAASHNVSISMGRRYPEVEHWFVMPDSEQLLDIPNIEQTLFTATGATGA